jgi:hypothetical protein
MHKNCRVNRPNAVAKSLQTVELAPFTRLGFINFKLHVFTDSVSAATKH